HLRRDAGPVLVRASIGRYGETDVLHRTDDQLVEVARGDLSRIVGTALPVPLAATVTRWGGALPQYAPGHLDRAARARGAGPPTIALAGAAYDGVGIPACVASGEAAAERLWAALGKSAQGTGESSRGESAS